MEGKNMSICFKCKYLQNVDSEGYIKCEKGINGKLKIYCKEFEIQ